MPTTMQSQPMRRHRVDTDTIFSSAAAVGTPEPGQVGAWLDRAELLRQEGRLAEAVGYYQGALQSSEVTADDRAFVAFRLGQTQLREGFFDEAAITLTQLIDQYAESRYLAQAYFLRGDAYLGQSQWQAAFGDFQTYLQLRPGFIDSYAYERMADANLALGDTAAALGLYQQAVDAGRTLVPSLVLREKVAQIYLSINDLNGAVAQYDAILTVAQNDAYRASIELDAAAGLRQSGQSQPANERYLRIFQTYPTTPSAYRAMQALAGSGITLSDFQRGQVAYYFGDYQMAVEAFNAFSSSSALSEIPAELYLLLGQAYRQIGNTQAALTAFQTIIEKYQEDPLFGEALLERGRTYFLADDIDQAIATYIGVSNSFGYLYETAAEALWRAAYLYSTNEQPAQARDLFVQLAQQYPQSTWAVNGLTLAAATAVKDGDPDAAQTLYQRISEIGGPEDQSLAYYWIGRLASQRGDSALAAQSFEQARIADPDSFFAARSADLNNQSASFVPPSSVQFVLRRGTGTGRNRGVAAPDVCAGCCVRLRGESSADTERPATGTRQRTMGTGCV